jgi:hypothetical protein
MAGEIGHQGAVPQVPEGKQEPDDQHMEVLGVDDGAEPDPESASEEEFPIRDLDTPLATEEEPEESAGEGDQPTEGETPTAEEVPSEDEGTPQSVDAPDYLPEAVAGKWAELPLDQQLLIQHAHEAGKQKADSQYSDDDRAVLARLREMRKQPAEPTRPEAPQIQAPNLPLPDEYKDDPGLQAYNQMVERTLGGYADYINANLNETVALKEQVKQLAANQTTNTLQQQWNNFVSQHPEINPETDKAAYDALSAQMGHVNPQDPPETQWSTAMKLAGLGGKKRPDPDTATADAIERGRRARATTAASSRNGKRTTGRTETPEAAVAGGSFEDTWRIENKNGLLPSQRS